MNCWIEEKKRKTFWWCEPCIKPTWTGYISYIRLLLLLLKILNFFLLLFFKIFFPSLSLSLWWFWSSFFLCRNIHSFIHIITSVICCCSNKYSRVFIFSNWKIIAASFQCNQISVKTEKHLFDLFVCCWLSVFLFFFNKTNQVINASGCLYWSTKNTWTWSLCEENSINRKKIPKKKTGHSYTTGTTNNR